MSRRRIFLVEDDANIAQSLTQLLTKESYEVIHAATFAGAKKCFSEQGEGAAVDLCLLDWMLPDGQGIDLLRLWRHDGFTKPVIFLTAKADVFDKVVGLEVGADDYVTKPFEPRELLARIHVRLRSLQGHPEKMPVRQSLSHGELEINLGEVRVIFRGTEVPLAKMEFELLRFLVENAGMVFSRDEILDKVWGYESYPTTRTVDTHVLQLRQKLAPELIETVRGVGYRFVKGVS